MTRVRAVFMLGIIFITLYIGWWDNEIKIYMKSISLQNIFRNMPNDERKPMQNYRNSDIMLAVILESNNGIVEFTSSVIRLFHNIPSRDIFISSSLKLDKSKLQDWYGKDVSVINTADESAKLLEIFELFLQTSYKYIFIVNGETVFSKDWKSFIKRNINKTDGFLSLYHSSYMHNYTYDCKTLNGKLCVGDSTTKYGVAFGRSLVFDFVKRNNNELKEFQWSNLFKEMNINMSYPIKSLTMQIGQIKQNKTTYCGENEVAYRFSRCDFPDWVKDGIEFYFDRCTNPEEIFVPDYSIEKINRERRFWVRPAISYSFYGSRHRYTRTAQQNAARVFSIYPGWKIWIYTDYTVPDGIITKMCEFDIRFIDMTGTNLVTKMSWRFLVASEPVKMFAVRDIDSWLLDRGKAAVDEWIASGRMFHTMRDHENHAKFPMNGGMWGGRYNAVPNMKKLLNERDMTHKYMQDINF